MMPGPYFPSGTEAPISWPLEKIRYCNFADQLGTTLKGQPSSRTLVPVGRTESSPSVQGPLITSLWMYVPRAPEEIFCIKLFQIQCLGAQHKQVDT